jgi:hypothetical protein
MSDTRLVSLAEHPVAAAKIRRAKAWAGIGGFVLMTVVGLQHGSPLEATLVRALVGGLAANLLVWAVLLAVVKRLLIAQATVAARAARARRAAAAAEAE